MLSHTVRSAAGLSANGVIIAFYHVKRSSYYSIYFLNIEGANAKEQPVEYGTFKSKN